LAENAAKSANETTVYLLGEHLKKRSYQSENKFDENYPSLLEGQQPALL
jgi:hypothetical protein